MGALNKVQKRIKAGGRVEAAGDVAPECVCAIGRVVDSVVAVGHDTQESVGTGRRVLRMDPAREEREHAGCRDKTERTDGERCRFHGRLDLLVAGVAFFQCPTRYQATSPP
jgi:hypothetical protein